MKKSKYSFQNRLKSFGYAFRGIFFTLRSEVNFQIHLVFVLLVAGIGVWLEIDKIEWLFLIFAITSVLVAELLNTAIEKMADWISPEYSQKAGLIKDIAAGAVLIAALGAVCTGIIIFGMRFWSLFFMSK